jgi:hypothetical protein
MTTSSYGQPQGYNPSLSAIDSNERKYRTMVTRAFQTGLHGRREVPWLYSDDDLTYD